MQKFTFENLLLFILTIFFFSGCLNEKSLVYLQKTKNSPDTVNVAPPYVPTIQPGDILSIYVNSLSPEASSFFNPYAGSASSGSSSSGNSSNSGTSSPAAGQVASPGYLVDPSGAIELPLLGIIKVTGLTTSQVRDTLKTLLKPYLREPTVLVRFLNFKISILGEVGRPSVYNIPNEMITITEALSMAGDLTLSARRDSILIVRDINGKKEFGYIDLSRRDLFSSPYYYLHGNDLIYVKPSKIKIQQNDRTPQYLAIGISLLSLIVILFRK